jgi:[protein-PII] uridylyltransferase
MLRNFPLPTQVNFSQDKSNSRTIMEVRSIDRVGFLAKIGLAMDNHGVRLQGAKIATYGERVEDTFFITDRNNHMVTDQTKLESLRNNITELLEH